MGLKALLVKSVAYSKPYHMASSTQILKRGGSPQTFQGKLQLMATFIPNLSSLWFTLPRNQSLTEPISR